MKNVILYARTSTKQQNINEQLRSLLKVANEKEFNVINHFKDDGKSGLISDREGFNKMMDFISNNSVDKILVTELSRLSRDIEFLKKILLEMEGKNVSIYVCDIGVETLINNKLNVNNVSVLMDQIKYCTIEVDKITKRLKRGYEDFRENGGKVGRKVGFRISDSEILIKNDDVVDLLIKGYSIRMIVLLTGVSNMTIQKVKRILRDRGTYMETKKTSISILKEITKDGDILSKIRFIN